MRALFMRAICPITGAFSRFCACSGDRTRSSKNSSRKTSPMDRISPTSPLDVVFCSVRGRMGTVGTCAGSVTTMLLVDWASASWMAS